jgi:hypothetical protein
MIDHEVEARVAIHQHRNVHAESVAHVPSLVAPRVRAASL